MGGQVLIFWLFIFFALVLLVLGYPAGHNSIVYTREQLLALCNKQLFFLWRERIFLWKLEGEEEVAEPG